MLNYRCFSIYFGYAWPYVASAFKSISGECTSLNDKLAAFFFACLNSIGIHFYSCFIDQRAYVVLFINEQCLVFALSG